MQSQAMHSVGSILEASNQGPLIQSTGCMSNPKLGRTTSIGQTLKLSHSLRFDPKADFVLSNYSVRRQSPRHHQLGKR